MSSQRERDRKLIAEAVRWTQDDFQGEDYWMLPNAEELVVAAARELNRIAREERKGRKVKRG